MSRVSVLVPTRGRPANVDRLLTTGYATAELPPEFIFYLDDDDPLSPQTLAVIARHGGKVHVGSRPLLSDAWNALLPRATHDLLMHCGDDVAFRTVGWDRLVGEAFDAIPDKIALVHGRDGFQDARLATHGFYHKRWVATLGYLVPPYFASDYNDLWNTELADAVGRRRYLPDVYTEHMHPHAGKGEWDLTHRERLTRHAAEDCDGIWLRTGPERARDVAKLRAAIDDYAQEHV